MIVFAIVIYIIIGILSIGMSKKPYDTLIAFWPILIPFLILGSLLDFLYCFYEKIRERIK